MKNKPGSVLLIVLMVTSMMLVMSLACWNKTSYFVDLVNERELFYKRFYKAEIALNAGIILAKKKFAIFLQKDITHKKPLIIKVRNTNSGINIVKINFVGKLFISRYSLNIKNSLLLRVSLIEDNINVASLRCVLTREPEIDRKNNKKEQDTKRNKFMVSHFTIGNSI